MSDIVTRLWGNTGDKYPGFQNLNTEAAAEITRLRARVAELEVDNADAKRLIAEELAETFKLFGILGLNEADDFGTKTAIEAVRERIESIKADRDRWKAEAMAARARLTDRGFAYVTVGPEFVSTPNHMAYATARAATDAIEKNAS